MITSADGEPPARQPVDEHREHHRADDHEAPTAWWSGPARTGSPPGPPCAPIAAIIAPVHRAAPRTSSGWPNWSAFTTKRVCHQQHARRSRTHSCGWPGASHHPRTARRASTAAASRQATAPQLIAIEHRRVAEVRRRSTNGTRASSANGPIRALAGEEVVDVARRPAPRRPGRRRPRSRRASRSARSCRPRPPRGRRTRRYRPTERLTGLGSAWSQSPLNRGGVRTH